MADAGRNDFKAFATDPSAVVLSQQLWDGVTLRPQGHVPGTPANAALENKALRQVTTMVAAFGQLVANTGQDAADNGNVNQLAGKLSAMINVYGGGAAASGIYRDSGYVVDTVTGTNTFTVAQPISVISTLFKVNDWIMINNKEMAVNGLSGDTLSTTFSVTNGEMSITDEGAMIQISFLELNGVEKMVNKNVAGGYCGLDEEILVPRENLPGATQTLPGVMRFATKQEAIDGADVEAAMNPFYVKEYGSAVAQSTIIDLVMTNWEGFSIRRSDSVAPVGIAWSPYLKLFAAIFNTGANTESIWTSPNGRDWTPRTHPGSNLNWNSIIWNDNTKAFVIVGEFPSAACILSSFDGVNWYSRTNPANYSGSNSSGLVGLLNGKDGLIIAFAFASGVYPIRVSSSDAINFIATPMTGLSDLKASGTSVGGVAYADEIGTYVFTYGSIGTGGSEFRVIYKSYDCISWVLSSSIPTTIRSASKPVWSPVLKMFACQLSTASTVVGVGISIDGDIWTIAVPSVTGGGNETISASWSPIFNAFIMVVGNISGAAIGAYISHDGKAWWYQINELYPGNQNSADIGHLRITQVAYSEELGLAVGVNIPAQTGTTGGFGSGFSNGMTRTLSLKPNS